MHPDLVCFSHLRWDFVYQRPQHLMSRAARNRQVLFVEEPVTGYVDAPVLCARQEGNGVTVVVPHLPADGSAVAAATEHAVQLRELTDRMGLVHPGLWYYTPMAGAIDGQLEGSLVVYDCMDELSGFLGAPSDIKERETALLRRADVVFTGGRSLFRAKRHLHGNMHCLPSAVDFAHFAAARVPGIEAEDQASIPHPRAGFHGVIDERMDLALLGDLAALRPDLQIIMIGPVVKIDPAILPQAANIHWMGGRSYDALPSYLAGWDVALLPFARNDATRFISPTKTPEYLAAGKPVVSTSIADVINPYGIQGLARIADRPAAFASAIDAALAEDAHERMRMADRLLSRMSWDETWAAMDDHLQAVLDRRRVPGAGRAGHTPWRRRPADTSAAPLIASLGTA